MIIDVQKETKQRSKCSFGHLSREELVISSMIHVLVTEDFIPSGGGICLWHL